MPAMIGFAPANHVVLKLLVMLEPLESAITYRQIDHFTFFSHLEVGLGQMGSCGSRKLNQTASMDESSSKDQVCGVWHPLRVPHQLSLFLMIRCHRMSEHSMVDPGVHYCLPHLGPWYDEWSEWSSTHSPRIL